MKHLALRLLPMLLLTLVTVTVQTQANTPVFVPGDCPFEVLEDQIVDCGMLPVPEDRGTPDSPTIQLAVAIIRSPNSRPEPDPLVYLEGGPGGSALYGIDVWYDTPYGANRDIILIDQRGTGYSEPYLGCDTVDIPDEADDLEYAAACRDALEKQGVNAAAYTSAASAADLNDLRIALGYDQINLYGISYGTRLALTMMRDFPQGLRSVVLDSTYPPQVAGYDEQALNADRAFKVLFAGCAQDEACNRAYPNLEQHFYATVDQLNDRPVTVDLGEGDQDFTGDDLINLIFKSLYDTSLIPYLPAIITEAGHGTFDLYLTRLDEGSAEVTDSSFVEDFTSETYEDDLYAEFEDQLLVYLDFDDYDQLYDYLDALTEDEYFNLLDQFIDEMPDEDFDQLLAAYLGYDNIDDLYDDLDTLADEDYNMLLDNFFLVIYDGYLDVTDLSDSEGMFNSIECYEEIPFNALDRARQLGQNLPPQLETMMLEGVDLQFQTCALWGAGTAPQLETAVVTASIPTLVMAGEYDPITPPAWGKAATAGLTHAYYFEFPGVGHGVIDGGDCPVQISIDFINHPDAEPASSCIAIMPAPDFYTGN